MDSRRPIYRFRLDLQSGVPVYRQIIDQVRGGIASGALAVGDQLPTVRQLAVDLSINPNTVVRAIANSNLAGCWRPTKEPALLSARKSYEAETRNANGSWPRS